MEFRANPDGSVQITDGIVRHLWPTMDDFRAAQPTVGGTTAYDRAARYGISLRESATATPTRNPDSASDLETISRTRETAR